MKKIGLSFILGAALAVFALIAVIMPAAQGLALTGKTFGTTASYSGYAWIFGTKDSDGNVVLNASAGLIIAWILMVLAACGGILGVVALVLGKDKKIAKYNMTTLLFCAAGVLAFVAGILFFCGSAMGDQTFASLYTYALGPGFIFAAIFGLIGGLAGIAAFVLPMVLKK